MMKPPSETWTLKFYLIYRLQSSFHIFKLSKLQFREARILLKYAKTFGSQWLSAVHTQKLIHKRGQTSAGLIGVDSRG